MLPSSDNTKFTRNKALGQGWQAFENKGKNGRFTLFSAISMTYKPLFSDFFLMFISIP